MNKQEELDLISDQFDQLNINTESKSGNELNLLFNRLSMNSESKLHNQVRGPNQNQSSPPVRALSPNLNQAPVMNSPPNRGQNQSLVLNSSPNQDLNRSLVLNSSPNWDPTMGQNRGLNRGHVLVQNRGQNRGNVLVQNRGQNRDRRLTTGHLERREKTKQSCIRMSDAFKVTGIGGTLFWSLFSFWNTYYKHKIEKVFSSAEKSARTLATDIRTLSNDLFAGIEKDIFDYIENHKERLLKCGPESQSITIDALSNNIRNKMDDLVNQYMKYVTEQGRKYNPSLISWIRWITKNRDVTAEEFKKQLNEELPNMQLMLDDIKQITDNKMIEYNNIDEEKTEISTNYFNYFEVYLKNWLDTNIVEPACDKIDTDINLMVNSRTNIAVNSIQERVNTEFSRTTEEFTRLYSDSNAVVQNGILVTQYMTGFMTFVLVIIFIFNILKKFVYRCRSRTHQQARLQFSRRKSVHKLIHSRRRKPVRKSPRSRRHKSVRKLIHSRRRKPVRKSPRSRRHKSVRKLIHSRRRKSVHKLIHSRRRKPVRKSPRSRRHKSVRKSPRSRRRKSVRKLIHSRRRKSVHKLIHKSPRSRRRKSVCKLIRKSPRSRR